MKKIASTILCAVVLLGLGVSLVGCGSATTAPTTPPKSDKPTGDTKTVEGKFESYKDGTLVIKVDKDDKEFKDVKDLVKDLKIDDFKKGETKVKVTTDKDGKATKIEKM